MEQKEEIDINFFDMESWAKYFALTDVFGSYHGSLPKSVKFYFNPVSAKFEPLLFDAHLGGEDLKNFILLDLLTRGKSSDCDWICPYENFYKAFLKNDVFLKKYLQYIEKYSSSDYISSVNDWYQKNYAKLDNEFYSRLMASDGLFHRNINLYLFKFENVTSRMNLISKRIEAFNARSNFFYNKDKDLSIKNNYDEQQLDLAITYFEMQDYSNCRIIIDDILKITEDSNIKESAMNLLDKIQNK